MRTKCYIFQRNEEQDCTEKIIIELKLSLACCSLKDENFKNIL